MAMTKGYCTNCNKDNEARRIFDVNSDVKFCYCPHCGKKYRPRIAIHNYKRTIDRYLRRANFFLRNANETRDAYNLFAYVLELEPTNVTAKLGRLLSLAYLSTLRRNRFSEVKALLEMVKDEVRDQKGTRYSNFLGSLNICANDYLDKSRKKLTFRGYFFDTECLKLYYKNLRDVIDFKRYLASEISHTSDKKGAEKVFTEIKNFELLYNEVVFTANGVDHTFTNFTKTGEPLITEGRKKVDTKLQKYRLSTLNKNDKKLIYIKDSVFSHAYIGLYRIYENSYIYSIINAVIAIGLLITWIVLINKPIALLFLILWIVFLFFAVSFLALRIIIGSVLKKPRS